MTIARLTVQRGDLTEYPIAEQTKDGWQNGVTFYPDADVVSAIELRVIPASRTDDKTHDDFCEADYIPEAGGYSPCSCSYRARRGLVAAHDAQVLRDAADRALDEEVGIPFDSEYDVAIVSTWLAEEADRIEGGTSDA